LYEGEIVVGREFDWLENTEQCPCMKALVSKEKAASETFLNPMEAGIICIYTGCFDQKGESKRSPI
jgi:hypothetical protein